MKELKALGAEEESQIREAVFNYFASCPLIPEEVSRKYGDMENDSIAVFSQQGSGRYIKQYVSGSYEVQFPFFMRYRARPTTNQTRLSAETLLDNIARWMCGKEVSQDGEIYDAQEYPALTDERKIEKIEAGTVYMAEKSEDGTIDYQVMMSLRYSKKGR